MREIRNVFITAVIIGIMIYVMWLDLSTKIKALNRETQVHWMIPRKTPCAVRLMFLEDSSSDVLYKATGLTCAFYTGFKQDGRRIKVRNRNDLEVKVKP